MRCGRSRRCLIAFAAWQPAPATRQRISLDGARAIALPLVFILVAIALETNDHFTRLHPVAPVLASLSLVAAAGRMLLAFLENARMLATSREEASTDALTGLGNGRRLLGDLEALLPDATPDRSLTLLLFDLNGFKSYNDTFSHPEGRQHAPPSAWIRRSASR